MSASKQVFQEALRLTREDRAELAHQLLLSLEPDPDPDAKSAWDTEIGARLKTLDQKSYSADEWRAAMQRVRGSLPTERT